MTLRVRTARVSYRGADRLDVTRKTGCSVGKAFAPSWKILGPALAERKAGPIDDERWEQYRKDYIAEMRISYREHPEKWGEVLRRDRVTLVCYCTDPERCHRRVLASLFASAGAIDEGEVTERDLFGEVSP